MAHAHDPLEASTTAHLGSEWIELRSILGSRRAFAACGGAPFDACARSLYSVAVDGVAAPAVSARAALRPDGDLELVTRHQRPAAGSLRVAALHVQRDPAQMTGTTFVVMDGDTALRRVVLDGERPLVELPLPSHGRGRIALTAAIVAVFALMLPLSVYLAAVFPASLRMARRRSSKTTEPGVGQRP
jgi:hypothetical protein